MQLGSCAERGSEGRLRDKLRRPLSVLTWPRRVNGIEKSGKVRSEKLESPLSERGQVWGALVGIGNRSSLMWAQTPLFANLIAERLEEQQFPLERSSNCVDSDAPKIDYGTTVLPWVQQGGKGHTLGILGPQRLIWSSGAAWHTRTTTTLQKALPPAVIKCSVACGCETCTSSLADWETEAGGSAPLRILRPSWTWKPSSHVKKKMLMYIKL